ncbi:hypothetical protein [Bradyrhizobium sp. C9]|uniref:hypothetical protein n=1 Tax=Bradyrhizobium sp. C9 TaxID=142585 RepID=UPI00130415EA|nr:hypothetical protein [Bradyrhizobium sp. C9]
MIGAARVWQLGAASEIEGRIERSVRAATGRKRVDRMLEELKASGVYMAMAHRPSKRAR